eukprot:gene52040-41082_t
MRRPARPALLCWWLLVAAAGGASGGTVGGCDGEGLLAWLRAGGGRAHAALSVRATPGAGLGLF